MPLRRFRRQYEQLSQFERGTIIDMLEAGWSARRVARQLGSSDCVVRRCWDQSIRELSFTRRPGSGRHQLISLLEDRQIRHTSPTAGVMEWGVIAYNTWSSLVLIRGTMTAQRYIYDILQPHVFPLMQRLPGAIFKQDNAGPHTKDCLLTVTTLPWPTQSPDLSPIEHI
ncbi:transposable element Tcb1 transposase [Trichonephila clavipes]|nr:transposable element Tcb1 transposase [Trichonephila clavipes]